MRRQNSPHDWDHSDSSRSAISSASSRPNDTLGRDRCAMQPSRVGNRFRRSVTP